MAPKMSIDTSRWALKLLHVQGAVIDGIESAVKKGSDILLKQTVKNVSGERHDYGTPGPSPGELPVTRITSMLKQSIDRKMLAKDLAIVYPDENKAPYAAAVHDGTKKKGTARQIMKPRRYLYEAVRIKNDEIKSAMRDITINKIRDYGLS